MTRSQFFHYGLTTFDVLAIAGVVLTSVLAWWGLRMVEFGLLPVLAAPFLWRRAAPDRNDWLTVGLFAQYAVVVSINIGLFAPISDLARDGEGAVLLYLGSAIILLLMVIRFRLTVNIGQIWRAVGPVAVLGSVSLLGWDHFTAPPDEACRVGFMAKQLLFPPIWLTMFAYASYFGWDRLARWERILRHVALAAVIISTVAFSGARAMLLAQAVTLPMLALILGWGEPFIRRAKIVAVIGAVSVSAFLAGVALDYRSGCLFADRMLAIAETVERADEAETITRQRFENRLNPTETEMEPRVKKPKAEASLDADDRLVGAVYIRPLLWKMALERIAQAPLAGYGYVNEPALLGGSFGHYHQQYLSWLVWGGPVMLVSGLAMLFAPLVTFGVARSRDNAVLALAMIGPLAIAFCAATTLLHTVMVLGYAATLGLFHALSREAERSVQHTATAPRGTGASLEQHAGG